MTFGNFDSVLITGGEVIRAFALCFLSSGTGTGREEAELSEKELPEKELPEIELPKKNVKLYAADRGLEVFADLKVPPVLAVGDFDSCSEGALAWAREEGVPLLTLPSHKDDSDTQAALREMMARGAKRTAVLGTTGRRVDHFLANIGLLTWARERGLSLHYFDPYNHLYLAEPGMKLCREEVFGKYLSFFAPFGPVESLTLTGFAYPLKGHRLTLSDASLTVSNELALPEGRIDYESGTLLVIESRDEAAFL